MHYEAIYNLFTIRDSEAASTAIQIAFFMLLNNPSHIIFS